LLFVVCIVTLDSYLMTPLHGGFLEATTNPPYVPLLVHRLIGNVSWTALFLAAFAALKLRRRDDEDERRFQSWALRLNLRIGLITAVAMPFDGFILLEVLKSTQFGYFDNLVASQRPWLFIIQEALLAVVFIGGNIALILEPGGNRRLNKVGWLAVAVSVVGMILACMPAAVLSGGTMWLRYAGIAGASGMTLLHAVLRCLPRRTTVASRPMGVLSGAGSRVIAAVGLASVVVALFMGYIKEQGRGDYSIYGELRDKDAAGHFQPPPGTYP
ncbi:MAG TPA: hypothetical protein VE219_00300, partial [Candidatus Sulfotelmatobacter sp.]|nr:hypothetical protein [Candidatus Sulfotelmatobacter sp.]